MKGISILAGWGWLLLVTAGAAAQDGRGPHDGFGESFAFCGDVDGDGSGDLAIGSSGEGGVGCVRVYSIRTGELILRHEGESGRTGFGGNLVTCPDVDGDGVLEIVSSSGEQSPERKHRCVELRSGRGKEVLRAWRAAENELDFGSWTACLGDVNGDGSTDLATFARVARGAGDQDDVERLIVLAGRGDERSWSIERPRRSFEAPVKRVCSVGDVDADGTLEIAALLGGEVLLVSGKSGLVVWSWSDPGPKTGALAGASIARAGDVDEDGLPDLVLGQPNGPGGDSSKRSAGCVRVLSSKTGSERMKVRFGGGQDMSSRFGRDVAGTGDLDGDGVSDWLATDQSGWIGVVVLVSGRTGNDIRQADWPSSDHPTIGWRVEGGPDLAADGVPDFATSCYRPQAGRGVSGQGVIVFSGKTGKRIRGFSLAAGSPPGEGTPSSAK